MSPTENGEYVYAGSGGSSRPFRDHGYLGYASAVDISSNGRLVLVWVQEDRPRTRFEVMPVKGRAGSRDRTRHRRAEWSR